MFRTKGGPMYDEKAVAKVHKNLMGTDFDFEDEFDDDFGLSPRDKEVPGSLRDFREQTKTEQTSKKVPLYMQRPRDESIDNEEKIESTPQSQIPPVQFNTDDEDPDDNLENESLASRTSKTRRAKTTRGRAGRGRSCRGRARRDPDHLTDDDDEEADRDTIDTCLLYTSPSPRDS